MGTNFNTRQGSGIRTTGELPVTLGVGGTIDVEPTFTVNSFLVGAVVQSTNFTSGYNFRVRPLSIVADLYADTSGTADARAYDRDDFYLPIRPNEVCTFVIDGGTSGQTGTLEVLYQHARVTSETATVTESTAETGTVTPKINGYFVGAVVENGSPTMGTGYTVTVYLGTDNTGSVLWTDSATAVSRSADRTTLDYPLMQTDSLFWEFSGIAGSGTGTLYLYFDQS